MNIKRLIELLQKYGPEEEVYVETENAREPACTAGRLECGGVALRSTRAAWPPQVGDRCYFDVAGAWPPRVTWKVVRVSAASVALSGPGPCRSMKTVPLQKFADDWRIAEREEA